MKDKFLFVNFWKMYLLQKAPYSSILKEWNWLDEQVTISVLNA